MSNSDIQRGLEQDARVVEERTPENVTKEKIKEIGLSLDAFIKRYPDVKAADVAKEMGISPTQLSQYRRGKYPTASAGLANKATHYMNTKAAQRRNRKNTPAFVNTSVARRIFTAIRHTEAFTSSDEGKMCMIVGDAGCGKSACLKQYAETNVNSVYVELDDTMSSKAIFAEIAKQMNTMLRARINSNVSLQGILQQIVELLQSRMVLVILDEASGLKIRHLNQLRQIITVRGKRSLVISGNNQLLTTIRKNPSTHGNESLDQFRSRLMSIVNLDELAINGGLDGGGGLYTEEDIRSLYEQLGVKLSRDAVRTLQRICHTPQAGRLRTCTHIIAALCKVRAIKNGAVITADYVFGAIRELGLPVEDLLPFTFADVVEESHSQAVTKTA